MSCVVGVVDRGGVCMGADSAITGGNGISIQGPGTAKLFRAGPLLIGTAGTLLSAQLVRCMVAVELEDEDAAGFLMRVWAPAAAVALKDGGSWKAEPPNDAGCGGEFMVAVGRQLFTVGQDMCVQEEGRGFSAIGSGAMAALGSLYSTEGQPPDDRVRTALAAAAEFCDGVRPPFLREWTGRNLHAVA
jgi:ATP-dependent protease HslVU (ClpYQ) peptidase subunit